VLGKAVEAFGTFKMSLEVSEACQNLPLDSFKKSGGELCMLSVLKTLTNF